jgi:hypothetical protein
MTAIQPPAPEPRTAGLEGGAPFSRTALWVIGGLVLASLAAVVTITLLGEEMEKEPSNGADGYSASSIGHRGLIGMLRQLEIPVVVSQNDSAAKAKGGLLVIAEPIVTDEESAARLRDMIHAADRVLVVLPKWWTTSAHDQPEWVDSVGLLAHDEVTAVLDVLQLEGASIERRTPVEVLPGTLEAGGLPQPTIEHSPQVITSYYFDDGVWLDPDHQSGAILGSAVVGDTSVTVLADPDVINNHGIDEGKNARFAVGLIEELREGGPVVFDEVWHGYVIEPSLWTLMFRWPLVLATLSAALCILVVVLATVGRFGPPAKSPRPIGAGKDFLIRNTAALLRFGGHDGEALRRYLTASVQQVRATIHAPRDLSPAQMMEWLERIRVARKGTVPLPELDRDVAAAAADPALAKKIPEIAMRIHRWRKEMTHGSDHHQ